jgi:hypothetical protein
MSLTCVLPLHQEVNFQAHIKQLLQFVTVVQEMLKYEALQEKLSELEYRHETREKKLREVVRDLLRRNAEHHALTREDRNGTTVREKLLDKNRQLCLYRAEVDRILETLREFSRHKMPGSTIQLPSD